MKKLLALVLVIVIIAGCVLVFDTQGKKFAKERALSEAGIARTDAAFVVAWPDFDDGRFHYNVSFVSDGIEHEYEVTKDGTVIDRDSDWFFD